jgi:hypothetical protein
LVQKRVLDAASGKFLFRVTAAGRDFLLQEGTDQRYGARHLKRAIERYVVYPMANLLATQQVNTGDLVRIDWDGINKELTFVREREGALVLSGELEGENILAASVPTDGRAEESPTAVVATGDAPPRPALPATSGKAAAQPLQGRRKESR